MAAVVGRAEAAHQPVDWSIDQSAQGAFAIAEPQQPTRIWVDQNDFPVARHAAEFFADDVERLTGARPKVIHATGELETRAIIVGTLGHSELVDRLVADKKLDLAKLKGQWESFQIQIVQHPLEGVNQALVIVGSDRRGTAYGVLTLSEAAGVSPWYYWADVTPPHKQALYLHLSSPFRDGPDVKYRGIFINDEWFGGLGPWASRQLDADVKNIGPKTYAKVFELLLRLRGNYLWPAMHPRSKAFNAIPENARLADEYGIVMGSSHCEILLRNNVGEWTRQMGDYNYAVNRPAMLKYWEQRLRENGKYENTYTIGLRGLHDSSMRGAKTVPERVALTQQAIDDERALLAKCLNSDLSSVPQVFCPYKEVLEVYKSGLRVPSDVTLLWADDNFGYIRNLSSPQEQQRPGGAGVYYHLSYHGDPESYLWLSSIPPALIASEMGKAYAYGAGRVWVFNVGDIKPAEKELTFAMQMAWDVTRGTPQASANFPRDWAGHVFGDALADEIGSMMNEYYRLAGTKPEQTWLAQFPPSEVTARLDAYQKLAERAEALRNRVPQRLSDAYFELVVYPIVGAYRMNQLHLLSKRSLQRAEAGDDGALEDARVARAAIGELDRFTNHYTHEIAGGKWDSIINWTPFQKPGSPSFKDAPYATPQILAAAKDMPAPVTLDARDTNPTAPLQIDDRGLVNAGKKSIAEESDGGQARYTWISNKAGKVPVWFDATTRIRHTVPADNSFWFVRANGKRWVADATPLGNIWISTAVGPQWNRVGEMDVVAGENELVIAQHNPGAVLHQIHIGLAPPPLTDPLASVAATTFSKKQDGIASQVLTWTGLGSCGAVVGTSPVTAAPLSPDHAADAAAVEYQIALPPNAKALEIRTLPTHQIYDGCGVRLAVSLNGGKPQVLDFDADEGSAAWRVNVLRGYASRRIDCAALAGATAKVRIQFLDPGVFIDSVAVR